jgi:hypothetical protein
MKPGLLFGNGFVMYGWNPDKLQITAPLWETVHALDWSFRLDFHQVFFLRFIYVIA